MTTVAEQRAREQERFIDDARRLLRPGEVKLHKRAAWLTERLIVYRRTHGLRVLPASMVLGDTASTICGDRGEWLDHWGTCDIGPFACCHKGLNFVSEPYGFGTEQAQALDRFCKALGGLDWHVSANTWWFPGNTVRITIHEKR